MPQRVNPVEFPIPSNQGSSRERLDLRQGELGLVPSVSFSGYQVRQIPLDSKHTRTLDCASIVSDVWDVSVLQETLNGWPNH
jgi:hypothetical protein